MLDAMPPDEAAACFIARRAEGLTASEQALLGDWLANEAHRRAFENADRAWRRFEQTGGNEILLAMRAHARAPRRRESRRWLPAAAVAAIAAVCAGIVFTVPGLNPLAPPSTDIRYVAARGQVRELQLPDGSVMTL